MINWSVAINTYSYIWKRNALETLNHLADLGYQEFEFLVSPPHCWPESLSSQERRDVSKLLVGRNLKILVLNPPSLDLNLVGAAQEMRRYSIDHYLKVIDLAADWGVPYVLVVPGKIHPLLAPPRQQVWTWFSDAMHELDARAEKLGVKLILENVPSAFLPRGSDLTLAIRELGNNRIGMAYDVANAVFCGEDPVEGLRLAANDIRIVHLSDTGTKRWAHSQIGDGVVPFEAIVNTLREIDLQASSVLEIISDNPDAAIAASFDALCRLGWHKSSPKIE